MRITPILFSLVFVLGLSCNSSKGTPTASAVTNKNETQQTLENSKWVLSTLNGADVEEKLIEGQQIYFTLDAETHRISGNAGCNTFTGRYTIEEGYRIQFSELATTEMMCLKSKTNESQILAVFNTAQNYTLNTNVLTLNVGKRAPLATFNLSH